MAQDKTTSPTASPKSKATASSADTLATAAQMVRSCSVGLDLGGFLSSHQAIRLQIGISGMQ